MQHHSLAHLLRVYCNYDADKKYQLADWRIRPLPTEMMTYARADTHFLLYVYDRLRNELLSRGAALVGQDVGTPGAVAFGRLAGIDTVESAEQPMELTLQRSAQTSLRTYAKDVYDADSGLGAIGWATLLRKWKSPFGPAQAAVYRKLHEWRDSCARDEDESTRYVLPNHMLFVVAEKMPSEVPALLALCRPTPPLVRLNATDIVRLIAQTRSDAEARLGDIRTLVEEEHRILAPKPAHIRFDDDTPATLAQEDNAMDVDRLAAPAVADDVLAPALLASVDGLLAPASTLFGSSLQSSARQAEETTEALPDVREARNRARQIRSNLVLTVAVPKSLYISSAPAATSAHASRDRLTDKGASVEPASASKAPIVISETYGRQKPEHKENATADGHLAKKQRVGDLDLSKIALGDIDDSDESNTTTASGKRTKKKTKKSSSKSSSSKRVDPSDVKPFDYRQNTDAIGKTPRKTAAKKKRGGPGGASDDMFDPYGNVGELETLDRRPKRHKPKSGSRTVSYKK
ncbi:exosome nuclease subunit [Coemansia erecta]|nr:exosome nuclease subunit [Coemansia erecta]